MATASNSHSASADGEEAANGAAQAAFLSAGIGAFAVGFVVVINEVGLFVAPSLYAPAGGVSGRTTIAVAIWLIAWAIMHRRWKGRRIESGRVRLLTVILTALGVLGTFPPFWGLL